MPRWNPSCGFQCNTAPPPIETHQLILTSVQLKPHKAKTPSCGLNEGKDFPTLLVSRGAYACNSRTLSARAGPLLLTGCTHVWWGRTRALTTSSAQRAKLFPNILTARQWRECRDVKHCRLAPNASIKVAAVGGHPSFVTRIAATRPLCVR